MQPPRCYHQISYSWQGSHFREGWWDYSGNQTPDEYCYKTSWRLYCELLWRHKIWVTRWNFWFLCFILFRLELILANQHQQRKFPPHYHVYLTLGRGCSPTPTQLILSHLHPCFSVQALTATATASRRTVFVRQDFRSSDKTQSDAVRRLVTDRRPDSIESDWLLLVLNCLLLQWHHWRSIQSHWLLLLLLWRVRRIAIWRNSVPKVFFLFRGFWNLEC